MTTREFTSYEAAKKFIEDRKVFTKGEVSPATISQIMPSSKKAATFIVEFQSRKERRAVETASISAQAKVEVVNIVWNGCDSYKVSNESVWTRSEEFKPFAAIEIDFNELPVIDGEVDVDGIFETECGRYFKAT